MFELAYVLSGLCLPVTSASMMAVVSACTAAFHRHLSNAAGAEVASTNMSSICRSPPVACSSSNTILTG